MLLIDDLSVGEYRLGMPIESRLFPGLKLTAQDIFHQGL